MKIPLYNIFISANDIVKRDSATVFKKINGNADFSFSFLILLFSSSVVCTLGLLLNSAPVVIGGMIISPLMWPLVKTAAGISYGKPKYIKQAVILLFLAIAVTFFSSTFITLISPIKHITSQILARTTPTLLDLVIALTAGLIAALGITQPKISESLAGVAIATSLMPPLCVSGIGLALNDYPTLIGGFLLFFTNAVAIIFITVLIFSLIEIRKTTKNRIRRKGSYVLIILILFTTIPLYFYLNTYSFKISAYQKTKEILKDSFSEISTSIIVDNIATDISNTNRNTVIVNAQILLPEDVSIKYTEQQKIVARLQKALDKKIDLKLNLQRTISVLSENDVQFSKMKNQIQKVFESQLTQISPLLSIDSLLIDKVDTVWIINAVLIGDPSSIFTEKNRLIIQKEISSIIKSAVVLNLKIVPLIKLQSEESVAIQELTSYIEEYTSKNIGNDYPIPNTTKIVKSKNNAFLVFIELKVPSDFQLKDKLFEELKNNLELKFKKSFTIQVHIIGEEVRAY